MTDFPPPTPRPGNEASDPKFSPPNPPEAQTDPAVNPHPTWEPPTGPSYEQAPPDTYLRNMPPPAVGTQSDQAAPAPGSGRPRPRWGLLDVLLGVVFIVVVSSLIGGVAFVIDAMRNPNVLDLDTAGQRIEPSDLSPFVIVIGAYAQQIAQGLWPVIVSAWRGLGVVADWRFTFTRSDLWIGVGTAFVATGGAIAAGAGTAALVGLEDQSEASNTDIIANMMGTPWLIPMLVTVVIGAPLTEELLFRGLVLRAFERHWGKWIGVVGSTLLFTLPHFNYGNAQETAVLFASIGTVGAILGVVTVVTNRLGAPIIAHAMFNLIGVVGVLATEQAAIP